LHRKLLEARYQREGTVIFENVLLGGEQVAMNVDWLSAPFSTVSLELNPNMLTYI